MLVGAQDHEDDRSEKRDGIQEQIKGERSVRTEGWIGGCAAIVDPRAGHGAHSNIRFLTALLKLPSTGR